MKCTDIAEQGTYTAEPGTYIAEPGTYRMQLFYLPGLLACRLGLAAARCHVRRGGGGGGIGVGVGVGGGGIGVGGDGGGGVGCILVHELALDDLQLGATAGAHNALDVLVIGDQDGLKLQSQGVRLHFGSLSSI